MEKLTVNGVEYVFWDALAQELGISGRTLERAIEAVSDTGKKPIISTIIRGRWAMRTEDAKRVKAHRQEMRRQAGSGNQK